MKLARLIDPNFHSALDKLAAESLPLKLAFRLKGIVKTVREQFANYEEVRKAALTRHGRKNEDGSFVMDEHNNVLFEQDKLAEFAKEINELVNMDIELPTISVSELGDKISLNLQEIEMLDGLIVED